ncbi:MAG: glycosyltransferase [Rhodanobacter sp.]|nr:MAG: glycosyltransferase [Rhodanobacter sp.]TAM13334.1 MAG: glycosyltransferase [Rhodanobacter sp.]TAM35107.1 MAG: glycosyltransferase [Rhodanobacter sp.]
MNITHVVENLNRGGLERMVIELVRVQHAQGQHCQIVCLYEAGTLAPEVAAMGVPVYACGKRRGLDVRALWRARRAVRRHGTEVLHTHNAMAHYQAVLACTGLGIRRVINTRHSMSSNRRAPRLEWLYRRALARTDAVVAVCEAARADAVALGIVPAAKSRVVRNGIPVASFAPANAARHRQLCVALGVAQASRIVGTVGRLTRIKDQANLIRAFAQLHAGVPDAVLVLVGDGPLRAELEQGARAAGVAAAVHFLGDRNDVRDLLQGFDLFVLCSRSEAYSMALLEASATALPIVATEVGGNGEIVQAGRTGWLVPPGAPTALADAMAAALANGGAAREYGAAARRWALAEGSLETMAQRYLTLYRDPAQQP